LKKVKEVVQELRTEIVDLEAREALATPPKEFPAREEAMKRVVASLEAYEVECRRDIPKLRRFGTNGSKTRS